VVTGDVTQIDLHHGQKSGLVDALNVLHEVRGIAFSRFTSSDVVRHPMVARIVDAYEAVSAASNSHVTSSSAVKRLSQGLTQSAKPRHAKK
jgi:phosphate starvation-inducible PhoH-like protein